MTEHGIPERQKHAQTWSKGGGRGGRRGEQLMVPRATFSSYYGRPVVKKPVWSERDIAGYLFTGGIAAGSAVIAAGADLQCLPALRRAARTSSIVALSVSGVALVHDLGRPERFYNMLRVFKPTSPMSVGSWILTAFSLPAGLAFADDYPRLLPPFVRPVVRRLARPASIGAAFIGAGVATYTAVLIADTSVPSWHAAHRELPFAFAGSALAGSSGLALMLAPVAQTRSVARLALAAGAVELAASQRIESRLGLASEPYGEGKAGRKLRAAKALTIAGALAAVTVGRRSRAGAIAAGAALFTASALTRFGVFEAGVASVEDPKYTVVPQRERAAKRAGER